MFNNAIFSAMQSSIFPKDYLRQQASIIIHSDRDEEVFNSYGLYMAMFDAIPSEAHASLVGTKIDPKRTIFDLLYPILREEGFFVLREDKALNEDLSEMEPYSDIDDCCESYSYILVNVEHRILIWLNYTSRLYFYYDCCDASISAYIDSIVSKAQSLFLPRRKRREITPRVNYISQSYNEDFVLRRLTIPSRYPFSRDTCYNDDFAATDEQIRKFLATPNQSGLVILHGLHGTGKSSYLKELVKSTKNKYVFVPMDVASKLTSPEFIDFVHEELRGSVIILEDCEQLLFSRASSKDGYNTGLAALLNMTDGIMGDTMNLKFICTFNNDLCKIDPALLRPGRLKARYEFPKLDATKTTALMNSLGHTGNFEAMTLAEIFNQNK